MHLEKFEADFERLFPAGERDRPSVHLEEAFTRKAFDPCFDIDGMTSVKKQALLALAVECLAAGEAYYEVGTFQGKSLISALSSQPSSRSSQPSSRAYACDNFSEFTDKNSVEILKKNLRRYHPLVDEVTVLDGDFRRFANREFIKRPVGVYFYDGAHDYKSQLEGIELVEPLLADEALVIVDDWRFAPDSQSHAKAATLDAMQTSEREWTLLYELPARYNGDQAMWWNGVGVLSVRKRK